MHITSINSNKSINSGVAVNGTPPAQSSIQELLDENSRNLKSLSPSQLAHYRDFNARIASDMQGLFEDLNYPTIGGNENEQTTEEAKEANSGPEGVAGGEPSNGTFGKGPRGAGMLPVEAARILLKYIDFLDTAAGQGGRDGQFTLADLQAIADTQALPAELKKAVEYVLKNPVILNTLDVAAGMGDVDGVFAKHDLEAFIEKYKGVEGFDKTYATKAIADALAISKAGDWTEVMEIVSKLSNADLKTLKDAYKKVGGGEISEAGAIKSAPSGPKSLLLKLLGYGPAGLDRQGEGEVDQAKVRGDAKSIKAALTPQRGGGRLDPLGMGGPAQSSNIQALVDLMGSRSKAHLQEVSKVYEEQYGKSLKEAILQDLKTVTPGQGPKVGPFHPWDGTPSENPRENVEETKRALLMLFN